MTVEQNVASTLGRKSQLLRTTFGNIATAAISSTVTCARSRRGGGVHRRERRRSRSTVAKAAAGKRLGAVRHSRGRNYETKPISHAIWPIAHS